MRNPSASGKHAEGIQKVSIEIVQKVSSRYREGIHPNGIKKVSRTNKAVQIKTRFVDCIHGSIQQESCRCEHRLQQRPAEQMARVHANPTGQAYIDCHPAHSNVGPPSRCTLIASIATFARQGGLINCVQSIAEKAREPPDGDKHTRRQKKKKITIK